MKLFFSFADEAIAQHVRDEIAWQLGYALPIERTGALVRVVVRGNEVEDVRFIASLHRGWEA